MSDEFADDALMTAARLGMEAESFIAGNLGRHIIARAEREIEKAYKELAIVDADNASQVRELQKQIGVARAVPIWLAEAIAEGHQAEAQIREEESEG